MRRIYAGIEGNAIWLAATKGGVMAAVARGTVYNMTNVNVDALHVHSHGSYGDFLTPCSDKCQARCPFLQASHIVQYGARAATSHRME